MLETILVILLVVIMGIFLRPALWWWVFSRHLKKVAKDAPSDLDHQSLLYYLHLRQDVYSAFHRIITGKGEMEDFLRQIAEKASSLFEADSWSVLLTPEDKDWSYMAWAENLDKVNLRGIAKALKESEKNNIKDLISRREVAFMQDTKVDYRWEKYASPVRSWLGIPLIVNEKVVGVLNLDWFKPHSVKPYMIESVKALVRDLTHVLESFEEFRNVVLESNLDILLKIPNRKSFDRFSEYVESEGKRVGLLLIDIEKFKRFNEIYGHAMGNELLKKIVRRISGNIRREDRLFRYGGDEFVIVVDNPSLESLKVMERKLAHIFLKIFDVEKDGKHVFAKVNIKVGFAIYPDEASSVLEALDVAFSRFPEI